MGVPLSKVGVIELWVRERREVGLKQEMKTENRNEKTLLKAAWNKTLPTS
jgi:hypothetical protein